MVVGVIESDLLAFPVKGHSVVVVVVVRLADVRTIAALVVVGK